jgi:hypothetical protein
MDTANTIYTVAALTFSLIAVLISAVSARRQTIESRRSNLMSYMTQLGPLSRSQAFREAQEYIMTQLSQFDPAVCGVYRLPEPACDHVLLVGGFYQDIGALVVAGVIGEDHIGALYYTGIKEAWRALEPYIRGERELRRARGAGSFFGAFEHMAVYVNSVEHEQIRRKFIRRRFSVSPVSSVSSSDQVKEEAAAVAETN